MSNLRTSVSNFQLLKFEALAELRFGLRSGIIGLIFIGLTAYLLMVLTNAGYLRQMGAADIPRNAPSLVYMMTSGDAFFLLFAWAWVFAQPALRDRQAQLHELTLACPVSLRALLTARFFGAVGVAVILGSSQMVGFIVAPVLEILGAVPTGSMSATPWKALIWAWLIFVLPSSLGCGALYLIAAVRGSGLAAPFGVAAALMMCWMFSMIVFKGNHTDPFWSTVLDPTGFAEAETQALNWTPHEKSTALLALTPGLIVNRLLWTGMPLLMLIAMLSKVSRETLALEKPVKVKREKRSVSVATKGVRSYKVDTQSYQAPMWMKAAWAEAVWQSKEILKRRGVWYAWVGLVLIGVAGAYVHVVGHAEGPLVPRAELLAPLMLKMMFLLVAFVVAGVAGLVVRRDAVEGFGEMLDSLPSPDGIRLAGRAAAVFSVTAVFAMVPGVSGSLVVLMAAPSGSDTLMPLVYQVVLMLPALMELAAVMVLMHALIRPAGIAYTASMLVAFILIINHELELITYPPAEIGIPLHVTLSGITGWGQWWLPILAADLWKVCIVTLLLLLAGVMTLRGTDGRLRVVFGQARIRLIGGLGAGALISVVVGVMVYTWQANKLVDEGGYQAEETMLKSRAEWERRWTAEPVEYQVEGGEIKITLVPATRTGQGEWRLRGYRSHLGFMHMELPHGLKNLEVIRNGHSIPVDRYEDHALASLDACDKQYCDLTVRWMIDANGWSAEGKPDWIQPEAVFARAQDFAPRLGLDREYLLRAPSERKSQGLPIALPVLPNKAMTAAEGIAPAGEWQWRVQIDGPHGVVNHKGQVNSSLQFLVNWTEGLEATSALHYKVNHDSSRDEVVAGLADDVKKMGQCVQRRLGGSIDVSEIVQLPRGLGSTLLAGGTLALSESPSWDVANEGTGRTLRRAEIATALARDNINARTRLRATGGTLWLTQGLAGALGNLCAADAAGINAFEAILMRGADHASQALAASKIPVGSADGVVSDGWLQAYGPLALLTWVGQRTPLELGTLLEAINKDGEVNKALVEIYPNDYAKLMGVPRSADIQYVASGMDVNSSRWTWGNGGWQVNVTPSAVLLAHVDLNGYLVFSPWSIGMTGDGILLDREIGLERAPKDNRILGVK